MVVSKNRRNLYPLGFLYLWFVGTPASYPECHRFESYLSHINKPRNLERCGAFSCICTCTKSAVFVQIRFYLVVNLVVKAANAAS